MTKRTLLPLLPSGPHGSRSSMTCQYRCGNACDHPEPNRSGHPHIRDEIGTLVLRRSVLKGAAVATGALALGGLAQRAIAGLGSNLSSVPFGAVAPNRRDAVVVADGFRHQVLIAWGERLLPDAPRFDVQAQTPEAARGQFGYNADYLAVQEMPQRPGQALLVVNHEYTDENLMFPSGRYDSATQKQIAMASHGLSVVHLRRGDIAGSWKLVNPNATRYNRRVHTHTPIRIDGPAAGDARLRTSDDPSGTLVLGTLNNCGGGTTPWGTVLSGEENFNQYFDKPLGGILDERYAASYARYGITGSGSRGWSEVEDRFDLTREPHEPFRFGWTVEIDPFDPESTPVKHTMLGRFKHEGAEIHVTRSGQVVTYMGDDERGDYLYRFLSADKFDRAGTRAAKRHNMRLLSRGTLSVARFAGDGSDDGVYDGTGEWIPLCTDTTSYVDGMSVADVLIDTRLAADKVAPTRMDRPEDVEVNPVNGKVYCALTNNSQRGSTYPVDEANPLSSSMTRSELGGVLSTRSGNRNGYVLELEPTGGDHLRDTFGWDLMLVCGDPQAPESWFAGFPKDQVSAISCPDNLTFDKAGNLWISTDGNVLGSNDGLFKVPTEGPERGRVQQFLTVPIGAETCGPTLTEDNLSIFFAVQHPGELDGATFEQPASTWPHTHDYPRPGVCVVFPN